MSDRNFLLTLPPIWHHWRITTRVWIDPDKGYHVDSFDFWSQSDDKLAVREEIQSQNSRGLEFPVMINTRLQHG